MGLLAMQVMPVADLYRHTLVYYELKEASLSEFFDFLKWHVDYVFYIILYVAGRLEIDFSIVRLLWVSVAYGIYFYIFNDVVSRKTSLSRKHYMLVFLFFIFYSSCGFGGRHAILFCQYFDGIGLFMSCI